MKGCRLKLYLFSCVLFVFSFAVQAQDLHFIYIQAENQNPFYIKIDGQTMPSSSSGYIIIPRLTQGSYKSYIGFPKTELGELAINFVVNDADAGYLVKDDVDQGLYIVNLLTMKFVPTERLWPVVKNAIKSKDEFARILSEVVNDPSINEIAAFGKPIETIVKTGVSKTVSDRVAEESNVVTTSTAGIKVDKKVPILKLEQKNMDEGLSFTYTDNTDTIDILIPVNKKQTQAAGKEEKSGPLAVTKKESEAGKDVKFISMELRNPNQADSGLTEKDDFVITQKKNAKAAGLDVKQKDSNAVIKTNTALKNTNCKRTATQTDFLNLRKKMAAEKTEAGMRSVAGKQFGNACYTTEQIKNLGVLFTAEEERYKFYVSAYASVSDAENFAALENQLADNYYISRFKAMLNH